MATNDHKSRQWLTSEDLAEREKVSIETVRHWRKVGCGPRGHRLGKHVRYDLVDVIDWEDAGADIPRLRWSWSGKPSA